MRRIVFACVSLGAGIAAAVWVAIPTPAHACSIVLPTDDRVASWVERSPIVAIGRWENVDAREVTLVVEQPLKGTSRGDRLPVDNRTTYTAMACSPYDEPFREGYRFVPGERAVVVLEKEVDGLWQIGYLALAAFEVPNSLESPLEGLGWFFGQPEAGTPTDIRLSTIVAAAGYEGTVSLESAPRSFVRSGAKPASSDTDPWPFVAVGVAAVGLSGSLLIVRRRT